MAEDVTLVDIAQALGRVEGALKGFELALTQNTEAHTEMWKRLNSHSKSINLAKGALAILSVFMAGLLAMIGATWGRLR